MTIMNGRIQQVPVGGRNAGRRGFSLVELVVTVAIMAILMVLAVPSLSDATLGSRLKGYANSLVAGAYLARGEAIKRNAVITLCASANGTGCASTGGWQQGWIVMCPSNNSVTCTTGGTGTPIIFQRQAALPSGFSVITAGPRSLSFQPTGVGTTQSTLKFCRSSPLGRQEREVSIGATGGTSVKTTTTGSCS